MGLRIGLRRGRKRGELAVKDAPDVPHHHVDEGVLDQAEEDEEGAGGHEHVYRLARGNSDPAMFDC